jgi:tetratricopeptide (TPR) repeat protein
MNDNPKGFWKKTWKGPRAFLFWLTLFSITAFIGAFIFVLIGVPSFGTRNSQKLFFALGGFTVAVAIAFLFYRVIRWFFCWRNLKRSLFVFACLATLIALFYAEEDWRGKHDWEKFKREWEAKGEHFDFASVVPPPVPDDQNFALTPIVFTSYGFILTRDGKQIPYGQRDTNFIERIKMSITHDSSTPTNCAGDRVRGKFTNLAGWQSYYRDLAAHTKEFLVPPQPQSPAADVLLALSKYDSAIEELRQASQLPCSRFPLNYDTECPAAILLPHLSALKGCSQVLQLCSIAELQNGQPEKALADVKLALQLTDKIHTEPILISHLVRIAMVNIALQPVWEGLAEHKWSDAQLAVIDQELSRLDFLAGYELAMRGECASDVGVIEFLQRHRDRRNFSEFSNWGDDIDRSHANLLAVIYYFGPNGWFEQSKLRICRFFVQQYLPLANIDLQTLSPTSVRSAEAAFRAATEHYGQFNFLERLLLPSLGNAAKKFAAGQNSVNLARVAIALERYRLTHSEYPESLAVLSPQFIAKLLHDIINGQPLHYRRTSDGQFVLYSVGWNETDDGGEVGFTKGGSMDVNTGDWVWRYPSK